MKNRVSVVSISFAVSGVIVLGLGLYFIFIRPPLLPEDPRFMGTSLEQIKTVMPGLLIWLRRVFWVMGGFMFSAGLLTCYVALTAFRTYSKSRSILIAASGLSSIGWMTAINFMIDSDFKWVLLFLNLPWIIALVFSIAERNR